MEKLKTTLILFGFLFLLSFTYALPSDSDVDLTFTYPINYSNIVINETSNMTNLWDTNEGILDNVADMSHSWLANLLWSVAGHIIDTTLDMNDNPITELDHIDFDLTENHPATEGRLSWSSDDGTLSLGMPGGNVNLQIGQEQLIRVKAGEAISNGEVVYFFGSTGNNPVVHLADATDEVLAETTLGIATEDIASGQHGYITTFGLVRDVDTSAFTENSTLYLSPTPGQLTETEPTKPNYTVMMGYVVRSHATEGIIFARIHQQIWKKELASISYPPTSVQTVTGTLDAGNLTSLLYAKDGDTYNVSEVGGSPGIDVRINFTNVETFNTIILREYYDGIAGHIIDVCLWDYDVIDWDCSHGSFTDQTDFSYNLYNVVDANPHINNSLVQMRLLHTSPGNPSHNLYLDYVSLLKGFSTITAEEVDPIFSVWKDSEFEGNYVPYTGATSNVNLSGYNLTVDNVNFLGGNITFNGTDNIWDFS